jgi:hypothetical protein
MYNAPQLGQSVGDKSHSVRGSDIERVEYTAVTRAEPALSWKIFADYRNWPTFVDAYGSIRWIAGEPWNLGSRLRIELVWPVSITITRLITMSRKGECVGWIDHARGSTMEQWVIFERDPDGGTCLRTWAEVFGSKPKVAGQPFVQFAESFIKLWFDGFCKECDRVHSRESAH